MSAELLFSLCNSLAPLGWILLLVAPRWKVTRHIVLYGIIPLLFAFVYSGIIISMGGISFGDFGSLQGIKSLFANDYALVLGWVHYLAFDLFVGSWILSNGHKHNIPHLLLIPCLFFTFMLGPVGLLLYFIVRSIKTKKVLHENF
jgi:hypothetical protein